MRKRIGRTVPMVAGKPVPRFEWPKKKSSRTKAFPRFYQSQEWRELRYRVLREQKGRCQACGMTAKDGAKLHVDHIIPISHNPRLQLDPNNLQILCEDCNLGKGATDRIDWRR